MSEVQIPEEVFESFLEDINAEYEEKICLQKTLLGPDNSFYCILIQPPEGIITLIVSCRDSVLYMQQR
jgi:hypothetical protein